MFDKTIRGRNLGQVCSPHFASIRIPALGFGHRTNSKVRLIVMTDTASLEGKNIIVTSAAGGLGRAMTEALAGAGAHVVTMFSSGQGVAKDKDPKEAVRWYSKVADHGNTKAQTALRNIYYFGTGVPKVDQEGIRWLSKAAEQGFTSAQMKLAFVYSMGVSVPADYGKREYWYRRAAELGERVAQTNARTSCWRAGVWHRELRH